MKTQRQKVVTAVHSVILFLMLIGVSTPALAASIDTSLNELLNGIKTLSVPVAIILLIFAGWQRMMGNDRIFIAAIIGTVIMFGAPQIVELIQSVFS